MNKVIIIAEAGVNHNGSLEKAFQLIDAAVEAGVDYVKFQTFKSSKLVSKNAIKADYQVENTKNNTESQLEMLQKLELTASDHQQLIDYCNSKNIKFFSTAFDLDSLQYLADIGLKLVKIPSGEVTNLPYLEKAASLFDKVILSTGMCTMKDIEDALNTFLNKGVKKENITVLHCNTEYPTPMGDVNLKAMLTIGKEFNTPIGYSDHTLGIEVPIAAVALGATVIEKHFTLDRNLPGPDHKASLEPGELKQMVSSIRQIELALGNGIKQPTASEIRNMVVARKSLVATRDIKKGELFAENNIAAKRPGNGIPPIYYWDVLGKVAPHDYSIDEMVEL